MKQTLCLVVFLCLYLSQGNVSGQEYGNEWINYSKTHYKFKSAEDGLHRISYEALQASGIELNPANFKLYTAGEQIPIYISDPTAFGAGDFIEFYGTKLDGAFDTQLFAEPNHQANPNYSLFETARTYFLLEDENGPYERIVDLANDLSNLPPAEGNFIHTARKDYALAFSFGTPNTQQSDYPDQTGSGIFTFPSTFSEGEGWLSGLIKSGVPLSANIPTPALDSNATEAASFRCTVAGRSRSLGVEIDQEIGISLQGIEYVHDAFDEFSVNEYNFDLPISAISTEADLTGQIRTTAYFEGFDGEGPGEFDGLTGIFPYATRYSVSFAEISYPRLFDFDNESFFKFNLELDAEKHIAINNFDGGSAPILYNNNTGERKTLTLDNGQYHFKAEANSLGSTEFIISNGEEALTVIEELEVRNFIDYSAASQQGDYLIITHPALREGGIDNVQAYVDYRSSAAGGDHQVSTVDINQLYDQFAEGINKHPLSIKRFVNYALDNWQVKPEQLYLLGKSILYSKIRNSPTSNEQCLVPSYGYLASDIMFVSDGDRSYYPRIPVGRFPANSGEEVGDYLSKVMEYESVFQLTCNEIAEDYAWTQNMLQISKGWGADHTALLTQTLNSQSDIWHFNQVDLYEDDRGQPPAGNNEYYWPAPESMVPNWQNGLGFIEYFGYSFGRFWQYDISRDPEVDYANTGKYPVILSLSAFSGQIHESSSAVSMSEVYVKAKNSGAIAFIGTAAISSNVYMELFSNEFANLSAGEAYGLPISEILMKTFQNLHDPDEVDIGATIMEFTFNGDPALKFYQFDGLGAIDIASSITCGLTTYTVTVALSGADSYNVSSPNGFNGVVEGSFVDGPFAYGTDFSYTVSDASNLECTFTTEMTNVSPCTTTRVELTRFDGTVEAPGNRLFWATGSEDESDSFTVERSQDGTNFTPIGTVKAAGNSSTTKSYELLDINRKTGLNYYRLSETDTKGKTKIVSNVIALENNSGPAITSIFPVPANETINIEFSSDKTSTQLELFNMTGQLLSRLEYESTNGTNLIAIDLSSFSEGTYFITISNESGSQTSRFIKSGK